VSKMIEHQSVAARPIESRPKQRQLRIRQDARPLLGLVAGDEAARIVLEDVLLDRSTEDRRHSGEDLVGMASRLIALASGPRNFTV
jgi:hypothetical protein